MTMKTAALAILTAPLMALPAAAQTSWDMATPYPDAEFHTKNIREFVADVEQATGGDLTITVHSGQSLFKHPEIKRSVQNQLVPIGEVLRANLYNENPIFGADNIPFVATSYEDARALWEAQRPLVEEKLAAGRHPPALHRALAGPGVLHQPRDRERRRPPGRALPHLQRDDLAHGRAPRHRADHGRGGGDPAGVLHRHRRRDGDVGRDRRAHQGVGLHRPLLRPQRLVPEEHGHRQRGRILRAARGSAAGPSSTPRPPPRSAVGA